MESGNGMLEVQRENTDPHHPGYRIRSHKSISKEVQLQYQDLQFLEIPNFQRQQNNKWPQAQNTFTKYFSYPGRTPSTREAVKNMWGILNTHEETAVVKLN